tara:strand:+ start:652 stop:1215 length:564 start_codon:yes stop_codon:yes gene_type:complete
MSISNFIITEYPKEEFYKDSGGKNSHLSFTIKFLKKIIFKKDDIDINIYSGNKLLEFKNDKEKLQSFQLIKFNINYKDFILHIKFRINKVSRRLDHQKFIIKISSKYFNTIESLPINVLSKKKRKRCDDIYTDSNILIINLEKKIKKLENICKSSMEKIKKLEKSINSINDYIFIDSLPSDAFKDYF